MYSPCKRLALVILGAFLWLTSGSVSAQVLVVTLQSNCPNNSCTLYIGADIPSPEHTPKPGPASGSANFNPVGQPWTFTLQTGDPLTWTLTNQGYLYTATFGEGGNIEIIGPEGTFSGVVTSGGTQGGDDPYLVYWLAVSFRGQWSDGKAAHGLVNLSFQDDIVPIFHSELTIIPDLNQDRR
jgi:hypothetical protein